MSERLRIFSELSSTPKLRKSSRKNLNFKTVGKMLSVFEKTNNNKQQINGEDSLEPLIYDNKSNKNVETIKENFENGQFDIDVNNDSGKENYDSNGEESGGGWRSQNNSFNCTNGNRSSLFHLNQSKISNYFGTIDTSDIDKENNNKIRIELSNVSNCSSMLIDSKLSLFNSNSRKVNNSITNVSAGGRQQRSKSFSYNSSKYFESKLTTSQVQGSNTFNSLNSIVSNNKSNGSQLDKQFAELGKLAKYFGCDKNGSAENVVPTIKITKPQNNSILTGISNQLERVEFLVSKITTTTTTLTHNKEEFSNVDTNIQDIYGAISEEDLNNADYEFDRLCMELTEEELKNADTDFEKLFFAVKTTIFLKNKTNLFLRRHFGTFIF